MSWGCHIFQLLKYLTSPTWGPSEKIPLQHDAYRLTCIVIPHREWVGANKGYTSVMIWLIFFHGVCGPLGCTLRIFYLKSLRSTDGIWQLRPWSLLVQVMACCLTAPSHYLNQYWLIISRVLWHSPGGNFTENTSDIYFSYEFENDFKITVASPKPQRINPVLSTHSYT